MKRRDCSANKFDLWCVQGLDEVVNMEHLAEFMWRDLSVSIDADILHNQPIQEHVCAQKVKLYTPQGLV